MSGGPLEQQICDSLPYNIADIVPNHASLAGLIAGFSLAGFILTVERVDIGEHVANRVGPPTMHEKAAAATLFALAALVGALSAYQYSAASGDHCLMAALEFGHPSGLLSVSAVLMVSAIAMLARSVPQLSTTAAAVRLLLYGVSVLVFVRVAADLHQDGVLGAYVRDLGIRSPSAIEPTLATRFGEASSALDIVAFQEGLEATSTPAAVARPTWVFAVGFACALAVGMAWRSNRQASTHAAYADDFRSWGRALGWTTASAALLSTLFYSVDTWNGMLSPNPLRTAGILLSLAVPIVVAVLAPHPYRRPPGALARAVDRVKRLLP